MADKIIKSINLLPEFIRTDKNIKFLSSTIDQLIQKPQLERIDGFIGSTQTVNYNTSTDIYLNEVSELRRNYQLEPSLVIRDENLKVTDVISFDDLVNELSINGAKVDNFDRLFRSEFYSFDPKIDWDKFINFQEYYWLITGPDVISISASTTANLIGQPFYTTDQGLELSNGMKITFDDQMTDPNYQDKEFFVEGVGTSIVLVDYASLTSSDVMADLYDESFDVEAFDNFPFDNFKQLPISPEYVTINRASIDLNPWTRYNRWVHRSVIEKTAMATNQPVYLPIDKRAKRPIIEFKPNIKLFNFGTIGIPNIDLIDTTETNVANNVLTASTYHIDKVKLEEGNRVIFAADENYKSKIYEVHFEIIGGNSTITLILVDEPTANSVLGVSKGSSYAGSCWWFDGTNWIFAQQRTELNQSPLFDLFDSNGHSYGDINYYSSDFTGNKIFGYDVGSGVVDPVLGFPLNYRNSVGVGSYLFKNYFTTESISIAVNNTIIETVPTSTTYFKQDDNFYNVWTTASPYVITTLTNILTGNSYYEIPLGLTNNPLNGPISTLTLSDISDHVKGMVDRTIEFEGSFPGTSNLRDLDNPSDNGYRLIANSNPIVFSQLFIGKKEHSLIDAISKSADQYNQFKLAFLQAMLSVDEQVSAVDAVDLILKQLNQDKDILSSYYLSDMIPYGSDYISKIWTVKNANNKVYSLSQDFDLDQLSYRSVLIYLNGEQLVHGDQYEFINNDSSVKLLVTLTVGDIILIKEYNSTVGSFVPSTPTKLGLYPKFVPSILEDDTYITSTNVIQGHDGSLTIAYNDYRDQILLEYETRVYNNLKVKYKQDLFNLDEIVPGAFKNTDYSQSEFNEIIQADFSKWAGFYGIDLTNNSSFDDSNPFTWNYTGAYYFNTATSTDNYLVGSWRAVYKHFYGTDRPHTHPWEMLGFSEKPTWWEDQYGSAPFTSLNISLWNDLESGVIQEGDRQGTDLNYARPGLGDIIPVGILGELLDPTQVLASNVTDHNIRKKWAIGEVGPSETAWRRSSYWPFVLQKVAALTKPSSYAAKMFDPFRMEKNLSSQWVYSLTNKFLNPKEVNVQEDELTQGSGYSVYVVEVGNQRSKSYINELKQDLLNCNLNLFYKVGGFVSKDKLQILIDSIDPVSASPGAILPMEDYDLLLNVSNPVRSIGMSGIIVQKSNGKFIVKGYDLKDPYFTIYSPIRNTNTPSITVGGISEPYLTWAPSNTIGATGLTDADLTTANSAVAGKFYQEGQIVQYGGAYYRVKQSHKSGTTFESAYFQRLPYLPIKGGATVQVAKEFDKKEIKVSYGTEFKKIQDVYDLILGYGAWLESQGFIFDEYNTSVGDVINWSFTGKEFLYWTTQNWANNSVITLSPFADKFKFQFQFSVVDNIFNSFYDYSVLQANGIAFPQKNLSVSREDGVCSIGTINSTDGIYFVRLRAIQKEHGLVFNNSTIFNDTVYDIETGYRQRRMKLLGFRTANWDGDYFSPGFVYDAAFINDWKTFTDYNYADIVRFNGKYYSANAKIVGAEKFDFNKWTLLGERPIANLLPNFDYKINQFEDFYSLDIDNFDSSQQKMAQHLIGYTPRVYLNNIFTNPVSQYKFYQGYIKEKGTRNSVNKLAKATKANLQGEIDYTEEWAFRVGIYGSYETFKEIEVSLVEGTFIENPQIINFVDRIPSVPNDLIYYSSSTSLILKPNDYVSSNTFAVTSSTDVLELKHAGYVRFDDVDATAYNEDEILSITDNTTLKRNDVIWLGNKSNGDWDVLRYSLMNARIINSDMYLQSPYETLFTTNKPHNLSAKDLISIAYVDDTVNGIYKVNQIIDNTKFTIASTSTIYINNIVPENPGLLFKFISVRNGSYDTLPSDTELLKFPLNSNIWIDDDSKGQWVVYQKINNFTTATISGASETQDFGWSISKQKSSGIFLVGDPGTITGSYYGTVNVFEEVDKSAYLRLRYGVNDTTSTYHNGFYTGFGRSVEYDDQIFSDYDIDNNVRSTDYGILYAGAPIVSFAKYSETVNGVRYASNVGTASTRNQEGLVKISKVDPITVEAVTKAVILSPNPAPYERFGSSLYFVNTGTDKRLIVGAPGTSTTGTGAVYVYSVSTSSVNQVGLTYLTEITTSSITTVGSQWGHKIVGSHDGSRIAVSAPGYFTATGIVCVYSGTNTNYVQTLKSPFKKKNRFGESMAMSKDGEYLFVSSIEIKNLDQSLGRVAVYQQDSTGIYSLIQTIANPVEGLGMKFGQAIGINDDATELVITSLGTNNSAETIFDEDTTIEDYDSTTFYDSIVFSGMAYIYNRKDQYWKIATRLKPFDPQSGTNYGFSLAVNKNSIYVGAPSFQDAVMPDVKTSRLYQFYKKDKAALSWNQSRTQEPLVEVNNLQKVTLIDAVNEDVIEYLDVVDPIKGKIPGIADQDIKYKSSVDPAIYSVGLSSTVNDLNTNWLDSHVGEVWWDLSKTKYIWYEQGELEYRKNNWGSIFPGSTIDVYEWVGSEYLPSEWAVLADTPEGLIKGISGQPKYPDNTVVSVKQIYNSLSNSFSNFYYFWVKNKLTIPNSKNRRLSVNQIASIIANPTLYGLKYMAVLSKDAVALSNTGNLLVDNRVHLNITQDIINNKIPRHTEWLLLQEGAAQSRPNALLEKKLIDSLLGHDSLGNPVPDTGLSARERYGVSIRPRQSLFKNRLEAIRNLIEFSNEVLVSERITGNYSFKNLNKKEEIPSEYSYEYDLIVEDNEGLLFIDAAANITGELTCTISNGKVSNLVISNPGYGYKIKPLVTIKGNGQDAEIEIEIDAEGKIITASIINGGSGYTSVPTIEVRPFTVIVLADSEFNGKWTKFVYEKESSTWVRIHTQTYNTTLYWNFVDWQSSNYNKFLDYTTTINEIYELSSLSGLSIGSYVKVKNGGDGNFIILEKINDSTVGTFTYGFDIVYAQNGTIKFSDSLWDTRNSNIGFDQNNLFGQSLFSQTPDYELEYIIKALKEDLFVNNLKVNWNLFFFRAVKFALSEQKLLDWAFKTSFINVKNYAGDLDQRALYKLQTSENVEKYLKEVKPYHTQIRTFTENYTSLDNGYTFVTDFDLPARYNQTEGAYVVVNPGDDVLDQYPWKSWNNSHTYSISEININNEGSGYTSVPTIVITTATGDTGSGATAQAYVRGGKIVNIEITNPGYGYTKAPTVNFITNLINVTTATAYAKLGNGTARAFTLGLRFDRTTKSTSIGTSSVYDEFRCDGITSEFVLTWLPNPDKATLTLTLDGSLVMSSDYLLEFYSEPVDGYSKRFCKIQFLNYIPYYGQILQVSYVKNVDLLNAVDRIETYYNPKSGMPGKKLDQLMYGIEYPKTHIQGLEFVDTAGWDQEFLDETYTKFESISWEDNISYFKRATVEVTNSVGTDTLVLSTTTGIVPGQLVSIIPAHNDQSTSTVFFTKLLDEGKDVLVKSVNTAQFKVTFNSTLSIALLTTSTGSYINGEYINVKTTATVELWTFNSDLSSLDSNIIGGAWTTSTVYTDPDTLYYENLFGIPPEYLVTTSTNKGTVFLVGATARRREDLILDGSGFITPESSYAPEEMLPGEAHESLGINVYTKNPEGSPIVVASSFEVYESEPILRVLSITPPNSSSIQVWFGSQIFSYNTTTSWGSTTEFNIDWSTNTLRAPAQPVSGYLGYRIISIGGGKERLDPGIIDVETSIVSFGFTSTEVTSLASINTVKSVYVTLNGESIPAYNALLPNTVSYELRPTNSSNNRASVEVKNISTSSTSTVTAWFFGNENKYFNETREQIISLTTTTDVVFDLLYPPGNVEPVVGQVIVELTTSTTKILTGPTISYYKFAGANTFAITTSTPSVFTESDVRVYINGQIIRPLYDYIIVGSDSVQIDNSILVINDVIAIVNVHPNESYNFDIYGNQIILTTGYDFGELRIITYTNHDNLFMRSERFTANLSRRYRLSRPVLNENYIWVMVNGVPLINYIDFEILDDSITVQISDKIFTKVTDEIMVISLSSDELASTVLGYRIFNDLFNRTHYKRLSKSNTTFLTKELIFTDTEIHVFDSSILTPPIVSKNIPGVVLIDGERIEFFKIDGNILSQLRRSTLGTSPSFYSEINTKVIDQSPSQTVPYDDTILTQTTVTTTSSVYKIYDTDYVFTSTTGITFNNRGITLSTGTTKLLGTDTSIPLNDQISVYYGGRLLNKVGTFHQDLGLSYDSPIYTVTNQSVATLADLPVTDIIGTSYIVTSTNQVWTYSNSLTTDAIRGYVYRGLNYIPPEFTVNTLTNTITLNIQEGIQERIKLTIVKKQATVWNEEITNTSTESIMTSDTVQAKFLQASPAELPDKYYYGGDPALEEDSGIDITTDDGDPLEGF